MDDVIARALEQQECVLSDGAVRWVLMLDGRVVRSQRGAVRSESAHSTERSAREAYVAALEAALREGFAAEHRDPPPVVRAQRTPTTPEPEVVRPASRVLAVATPTAERSAAEALPAAWAYEPPDLRVTFDGMDDPCWAQLVDAPTGATHLELLSVFDWPSAIEAVHDAGLPPWAQSLCLASFDSIEEFVAAELDAASLWPQLERLERLELRAGRVHLPPTSLPRLRHLELWCADADPAVISSLVAEPWPELRSLRLWLARVDHPGLPGAEVLPLFDRDRFPKLTSLGLHALSEVDDLPRALAASTLGPQLTTWVIDGAAGRGSLPEPDGIELLSTGEFFPLRSGRFNGR